MRWALLYNDTADCIFPQFCYSSCVKKIRSFRTFDVVVFQWAMSLSSARIVARLTGGFGSPLPLGRLVGHSWDSWHFLSAGQTDTQTCTHTSPRPLSLSLSFSPLLLPGAGRVGELFPKAFVPPARRWLPCASLGCRLLQAAGRRSSKALPRGDGAA